VVLNVATPLPFTATADARVVAPSVNLTVPVGTPEPEVTVAVNVTDWPKVDGFGADVTPVLVAIRTICAVVPLLFCQPFAPVNEAVIVWLPDARAVVLKLAIPLPFTATLDAKVVAPSVKFTEPVGTPPPEVIVAVNVTD